MLKLAWPDPNFYFQPCVTNCRCCLRGNTEINLDRKNSPESASMYLFRTIQLLYTNSSVKPFNPCVPLLYILSRINIAINIFYMCSITTIASPKWEPREREKDVERLCICLQSMSWPGGPRHIKSRMCESIRARVLLFMFIRKWRHRPPPLPLCSQRWRRWRSRARWHRWTWTATHPAGRVQRQLMWRQGRWPRNWRASARRCSRRWVRSPWRPPSSWGSEK